MAESDIFLATYSSVGVEAIAFGLPVIMMLPNSTPDMSLYHSHHVPVLKASSADELREHVNKLASNPDFVSEYVSQLTDVLHDSFGPTDSQASQRLAKLCADIRNSHNATEGVEIPSNKIPTVAG
jgi:CDP-glycerol glycerophosphotransferase (TagB/SpsB family)